MVSRNFFAKCVAIERTIGAIYAHLSELDCYPDDRRQLWKKLSQDESGHALDLELAGRIASSHDSLHSDVPLEFLEEMLDYLNGLFSRIKITPLSDVEAVKMAVEIEAQTMVVHARTAVQFNDTELQRVFAVLGTYDAAHLGGLAQAYQQLFEAEPTAMLHAGMSK